MPIKPKKGQTKNQFMDFCMHEITHNRKQKREHQQRVAVCLSYWNEAKNEDEIIDKLDMLTEKSSWKSGMWVVQKHRDFNIYMYLVDQLKSGGWTAITISDDRPVAAKQSIRNAYPQPEPIDEKKVPQNLKAKVEKKKTQLGIK